MPDHDNNALVTLGLEDTDLDPGAFTADDDVPGDHHPDRQARTAKPRTARPKVDPQASRSAVENVLALLARANGTPTATPGSGTAPVRASVPSARARAVIEHLVQLGTIEALDATSPNLKVMCRDLFDWHSPDGQNRASGNVVKAFGRALTARDDAGHSLYSQAVEMAGFAAAAAPLLQPDRLARIIDLAPTVTSAFAPERYTMQLTGALRTVLSRYPEQRREQLLATLWTSAHDGRWWDMTSGVVTIKVENPRRRRRNAADAEAEEAADEAAQAAEAEAARVRREVLAGVAPEDVALTTAVESLLAGTLAYTPSTATLVHSVPHSAAMEEVMVELADRMRKGEAVDPDRALTASHLPWLLPSQRPESPITWLAKTLVRSITPDEQTGQIDRDAMPAKPKAWKDLYPLAELVGFPYPPEIRALHRSVVPGTDATDTPAIIELITNPAELAANRDYMGNCTWSYKDRLESGQNVLFKIWHGQDCFNVALARGEQWAQQTVNQPGARWVLREMNSRFNEAYRRPELISREVRAGVDAILAALPNCTPLPDRKQREAKVIRYAV